MLLYKQYTKLKRDARRY